MSFGRRKRIADRKSPARVGLSGAQDCLSSAPRTLIRVGVTRKALALQPKSQATIRAKPASGCDAAHRAVVTLLTSKRKAPQHAWGRARAGPVRELGHCEGNLRVRPECWGGRDTVGSAPTPTSIEWVTSTLPAPAQRRPDVALAVAPAHEGHAAAIGRWRSRSGSGAALIRLT
jgi:hypothetical protein